MSRMHIALRFITRRRPDTALNTGGSVMISIRLAPAAQELATKTRNSRPVFPFWRSRHNPDTETTTKLLLQEFWKGRSRGWASMLNGLTRFSRFARRRMKISSSAIGCATSLQITIRTFLRWQGKKTEKIIITTKCSCSIISFWVSRWASRRASSELAVTLKFLSLIFFCSTHAWTSKIWKFIGYDWRCLIWIWSSPKICILSFLERVRCWRRRWSNGNKPAGR